MKEKQLAPRLEDYLETIYLLEMGNGVARVKEIAKARNVKMPTVTDVLRRLSKKGYITYEPYGYAKTTEKGKAYAEDLYGRHRILVDFMETVLHLPTEVAMKEGCLMEHILSKDTVKRFQSLTKFFKENGLSTEFKEFLCRK